MSTQVKFEGAEKLSVQARIKCDYNLIGAKICNHSTQFQHKHELRVYKIATREII